MFELLIPSILELASIYTSTWITVVVYEALNRLQLDVIGHENAVILGTVLVITSPVMLNSYILC